MTVEYLKGLKSAFKYFRVQWSFRSISPSTFLDFTTLYKSSEASRALKVHQNLSKTRFQKVAHFLSIFLRFWLHFGGLFGPLGASWGPLGGLVDFSSILAPFWRPLGASWGLLGTSWGLLGASWGPLGNLLGDLGDLLGGLWGLLGASWGIFGASWGILGGLWEPLEFFGGPL